MKKETIFRAVKAVASLDVSARAAAASFFLILSAFPALVLMLGLLRYTGLQAQALTKLMEAFIPDALMGYIRSIVNNVWENTSGTILSVSALTTLWSASRGVYGILTGFNAIYQVAETRGWLLRRLVSLAYTLLFILVLLLTLLLSVFGTTMARLFPGVAILSGVVNLRFWALLAIQTALFTAMYALLPGRRNRFRDSFPGALLASLGWLLFSDLFSVYVENFYRYANIYGSVCAVGLGMLWLYFCMSILFFGAVLNRGILGLRERKQP